MSNTDWFKLEIFVPSSHLDAIRIALQETDAGHIGNYDSCLAYSPVKGRLLKNPQSEKTKRDM